MARILMVDDDLNVCRVAQVALEDEGHKVDLAYDGSEGMEKALNDKFDLIITDLMMPKIDGLTMLTRLRRADVKIPAILSTSLPEENITYYPPKPYNGYLGKPYVLKDLNEAIDRLLENGNSSDPEEEKGPKDFQI